MAKKPYTFAHFFGRGATASSEEEEDKKVKKAKSRRADDDDKDDPDADNDDPDKDADNDDPDKDVDNDDDDPDADNDDPDADDDDGDDKKESKSARQARISERHRCARIFSSPHAAANPALAASLAFNTGMSSAAAISVMASQSPVTQLKRARSLDERMQDSQQVRLNPDGGKQTGKSALVSKMTSLYNSAKGDK